jgi:hypothetical protein
MHIHTASFAYQFELANRTGFPCRHSGMAEMISACQGHRGNDVRVLRFNRFICFFTQCIHGLNDLRNDIFASNFDLNGGYSTKKLVD